MTQHVGISRNYPTAMPLAEALAQHERFALGSMKRIVTLEAGLLNVRAGFFCLTAYGPPRARERRALDDLFGLVKA